VGRHPATAVFSRGACTDAGDKVGEILNWLDDHCRYLLACTAHTTVTVINLATGEVLSHHDLDPTKNYWRNTQRTPGRWPGVQQREPHHAHETPPVRSWLSSLDPVSHPAGQERAPEPGLGHGDDVVVTEVGRGSAHAALGALSGSRTPRGDASMPELPL